MKETHLLCLPWRVVTVYVPWPEGSWKVLVTLQDLKPKVRMVLTPTSFPNELEVALNVLGGRYLGKVGVCESSWKYFPNLYSS
jgi:hypothetical protein